MSYITTFDKSTLKLVWQVVYGPKEYGQYLLNKRNYSHKRTNK